jgi:phage-related protein
VIRRRWTSFDSAITNREILSVPAEDRKSLFLAMRAYREGLEIGYEIEDYGSGIKRLRRSGKSQGRCLFFAVIEREGVEVLVALLFYKKETRRAPTSKIEAAKRRMNEYKNER